MNGKKYCLYKHTSPSGKVYIGITSRVVNERWRNGRGYQTSPHFYSAILKYGWDNIAHEILFDNLSEAEAKMKEVEYINKYKSSDPRFGYNLTSGGDGRFNSHPSDETRKKISETQKGRKQSSETIEKRRVSLRGRHRPDDERKRISMAQPNRISILQFDKQGHFIQKFDTMSDAERITNISRQNIRLCCRGKRFSAGGYVWKFEHKKNTEW